MAFLTALTATQAAAGVSAVTSIAAARQASAIGSYNQSIQNRNAQIAEQEAERLEQQKEFDIARFDQQFARLQGQTRTNVLFSGAELSGSGLRILRQNAEQAEIEKDILDYNSKVKQSQKLEEANFARMQGTLAKRQAGLQALSYYGKAGTSLLGAFG
jgi:tetrahydromethanopterin S-methyltransferase subunit H